MKYPCNICGKYGHCKRKQNRDGSLPSHDRSCDFPNRSSASNNSSEVPKDWNDNEKNKTVSNNIAALVGSSANTSGCSENTKPPKKLGLLVDSAAPYSAIGLVELNLMAEHVGLSSHFKLASIPDSLNGHTHWKYGKGKRASQARRILGSIVLTAISDNYRSVCITHLVLDGSSQWVIGQKLPANRTLSASKKILLHSMLMVNVVPFLWSIMSF